VLEGYDYVTSTVDAAPIVVAVFGGKESAFA
jgi:hypothetical protein